MRAIRIKAIAFIALLIMGSSLAAQIVLSPLDRTFLAGAVQSDRGQIALAELAMQKAQAPQMRRFAAELARVRDNHRLQAVAMARLITVHVNDAIGADASKSLDALAKLEGAAFDQAYKQHVVADHRRDIESGEALVKTGENPGIRALTEQTIPRLRKLLRQAEAL